MLFEDFCGLIRASYSQGEKLQTIHEGLMRLGNEREEKDEFCICEEEFPIIVSIKNNKGFE